MGDRLKDKVAIVTGAGASGPGWGNGKATAAAFAREGAKVFAVDLNLEAAAETVAVIKAKAMKQSRTAPMSRTRMASRTWSPRARPLMVGWIFCTTTWASPRWAGRWKPAWSSGSG